MSAVVGTWEMTIGRKGWRLLLASERKEVTFDVDLASPLSFAREPRIALHLARLSAISVDAQLLVQMAASTCTLPELRWLTLGLTARPEWPSGEPAPIRVPQLEVSLRLDAEADGAGVWVTATFPKILRSRLAFERPLLAHASIEADSDVADGLEERNPTDIRALAECVRVEVASETRKYDPQRG